MLCLHDAEQRSSKIAVRQSALQENEATGRTTHKQAIKALLMFRVSNRIWILQGTHQEPDTSSLTYREGLKGLALYHRKGHFCPQTPWD